MSRTPKKSVSDLFAEYDDPDYWDEYEGDRRDYLGVMISYADVKRLYTLLPRSMSGPTMLNLLTNLDRWTSPVEDRVR